MGTISRPSFLTVAVACCAVALLAVNPVDTDGDGLPDTWEVANGTNPSVPDAALDSDGDGLSNLQEYLARRDPWVADSWAAVRLEAGWNMIAIPSNAKTRTYDAIFLPNRTLIAVVWWWDARTGGYREVVPGDYIPDSRGYWLYSPTGGNLVYEIPASRQRSR